MSLWALSAGSLAVLEPLAAVFGWRYRLTRPLPLWAAYMVFLIPFRVTWLLAPMDTPGNELRPRATLWLLDGARVLVTAGAIRLLLWDIRWGTGERVVRWRWALVLAFGAAVLAMAVHATWFGLVRVVCFVALVTAIAFSAAWKHPVIPFQAKYAGIMAVYLGSSAFASLAKSVRGDAWDTAACAIQAGCAAAWILMLRGKI